MGVTRISTAHATVTDSGALSHLAGEIPDAEETRGQLCKPFFARRWQQSRQRSFWITSDGVTAVCLTVIGLDVDAMVALRVAFDGYRIRPGFSLSASSLGQIIQAELGVPVEFGG